MDIGGKFSPDAEIVLFNGDCRNLLRTIPRGSVQLIVTSPPYNTGKDYEHKQALSEYLREQAQVIRASVRTLAEGGSICWQVGNQIGDSGEIYPLDILLFPFFARAGLKLRNRIVWHFEHGLHCTRRLSGRHETILWFTKGDRYVFNLDPIRVPQKYPGKRHFKGPNNGTYSGHPNGKNPGDVWMIPNVKHNHIEKTIHPCQFPVELVERLVLSLSDKGALVLDPYMGVGTTAIAASRHGRRVAGAEISEEYYQVAIHRLEELASGRLRTRPMGQPIYEPPQGSPLTVRTESVCQSQVTQQP